MNTMSNSSHGAASSPSLATTLGRPPRTASAGGAASARRGVPFFVMVLEQARRVADVLGWLPPTAARLGVGWVFATSGWGKIHNLEQVTGFFMELGLPAPGFHAVLVSTTELVCGSLLLIGLATRLAALPLIVTMIVAIRTALWADVDSLGALFGLSETLYVVLLAWLATAGPGPLSIDALFARRFGPAARRGGGLPSS